MDFRLFFPSEPWAIALLVLSLATVVMSGLRRMRVHAKPPTARRMRSYGVPLVACFVCCAYGTYLNTPRSLDCALIAGLDELKQELQSKGQSAGSLSVLSGFPFAWYQAQIEPVKYKFIGGRTYVLRFRLSVFVFAATVVAMATQLWHVSEVSLSHLIVIQTVLALVIFLHVCIDPTYHWTTSAILLAAPQLVYLPVELRRVCIAWFARSVGPVAGDAIVSVRTKSCEVEAKV